MDESAPKQRAFCCLVIAMSEMTDFFQKEAQGCRSLAAQAIGKNDREYWLRLAHRWEWLVQQKGGPKVETNQPLRRERSVIDKRFAKRRAA
jgi:hypothetical protein